MGHYLEKSSKYIAPMDKSRIYPKHPANLLITHSSEALFVDKASFSCSPFFKRKALPLAASKLRYFFLNQTQ